MKKSLLTAAVALLTATTVLAEDPAITLTSNIYANQGADNYFTLEIGTSENTTIEIDCGSGRRSYDVVPAGTSIGLTVTQEAVVKIYGDPTLFEYFYAEGCYLNGADFGDCVNLDVVNLDHNELTSLDLSKYTKLRAVYVGDNPFSESTPFVLGDNHPQLVILDMAGAQYIDQNLDITTFPELQSFDAYACPTLRHLDPTNCPKLLRISVDSCPLTSLDVTKNPLLRILNIEDSGISSIDLTKCPQLSEFYGVHGAPNLHPEAKMTSIDVSKNPELVRLALNGNKLTTIDVSNNPKLIYLNVGDNLLTDIDITNNTVLSELDIFYNYMDYATMPLPGEIMTYNYWQHPLAVDKSYPIGTTIDFSKQVLREGTVTTPRLFSYSVNTATSTEITDASAFTYDNGRLTLNRVFADSLYVQFDNDVFNEWPLTTGKFKVKSKAQFGQPDQMVKIGVGVDVGQTFTLGIGFEGATAANPVKYYMDLGDGQMKEFYATSATPAAQTFTKASSGYTILYADEDTKLTAFEVKDIYLTSVDVTAAHDLLYLTLSGTSLYQINLAYNWNLRSLDLSNNFLSTISLEGINGMYSKNMLSRIDLSGNKLIEVTLNDTRAITHLNLADNLLETFTYKDFDNIKEFNLSGNKVTTLDLSYFTAATKVNISNNQINVLAMPETNVFESFDVSNNNYSLADIPEEFGKSSVYIYAPQNPVSVPTKGPGIDLKDQNRVINGKGTSYKLYTSAGKALTEGTDYSITAGRISFLQPIIGQTVYCEMTNPNFPGFDANPLRTTETLAAEFPTNCVATFVTPTGNQTVSLSLGGTAGSALYIDWNGQGTDLYQYPLKETYTLFDATTVAGATVKAYTYSTDDKVTIFSLSGATMSSLDLSGLTDASTITVQQASLELDKITFPADRSRIRELSLDGNRLTSFNPAQFPSLFSLSISSNRLTSLDVSSNKSLQLLAATHNQITSLTLNNPVLWFLNMGENQLASVDLSKAPMLEAIGLSGNQLASVDLSAQTGIKQLVLDRNKFTFTTLPPVKDTYIQYTYANQAALEATCDEGKVDLSSQAVADGVDTEYRWYIDEIDFDEDGNIQGEELLEGTEYTVENGVTSFMRAFSNVQCVMTNSAFPDLYLRTNMLNVTAGIDDVTAGTGELAMRVTALDGGTVIVEAEVSDGTPTAVYTLDGRKAGSATFRSGKATITGLPAGAAVLTAGNTAAKLIIR